MCLMTVKNLESLPETRSLSSFWIGLILFDFSVQEKVDILNEKVERESLVNEKQGFDYPDFDPPPKVLKHKCE